jgi:hypothetical protein
MAIQQIWNITRMDAWVNTKIVFNVHFSITTLDTDRPPFEMIQNHAVAIPHNPSDPTIPYDELTEVQVIDWVKAELKIYELDANGEFVLDANGNRIEIGDITPDLLASGISQLEDLINPKAETYPLPWAV